MHSVRRETLANGLRLIVAPLPHLHTTTIAAFVKVGSRNETGADNGLSHFLEHMLFRGTERRPSAYELNLAIEELGGTLDAATHVDFTLYQLTVPPESLEGGLEAMGEILRAPAFADIETEKRIVQEEILEGLGEDGQDVDVDDISRSLLFAPHALGLKLTGSAENVDRFSIQDLRRHMERYYGASNTVLCLSGAVSEESARESVDRCFGSLPSGQSPQVHAPEASSVQQDRFRNVHNPGSQTEVRACFPTFGARDPEYAALKLLLGVLDDGMSTRLHRRICDEMGLAYDAFAAIDPYEDSGVFDLGATVEHAKAPDVLRELLTLLRELREEPVTEAELEKARRRYLWDLRATLDDAEAVASFYGTHALFGIDGTLDSLADDVRTVTADQIQRLARALFTPRRLHVACVGMLGESGERDVRAVFDGYE